MKKLFFCFVACVGLSILFNSCSIEKRLYQKGYHISWSENLFSNKNKVNQEIPENDFAKNEIEEVQSPTVKVTEPNIHSVETISASTTESFPILSGKKNLIHANKDTVIPDQPKTQEEYFSNNYTNPLPTNELQDTKLANWALGLGIGAVTSPLWVSLLFLLIFTLAGAAWSGGGAWAALGLAILLGVGIFITLEILAITFAIRFLRLHAKDPNYRKYRSRAITGLILAGIYPALILLNIIIGLALI
jgi:hypothetical protein